MGKVTALSAITSLTSDDLVYVIDDPGGTPASKKITSANFIKLWGPLANLTPPVSGDFTWVNQGGASVTTISDPNGGIYISAPAGSGNNIRARVKSVTAPYTITAGFLVAMPAVNFASIGLLFRKSSDGSIATAQFTSVSGTQSGFTLASSKYTDASTFSADYTSVAIQPRDILWLQISDNNTNRIVRWSPDGQNWQVLHTVVRTDFLTANQVGFFAQSNNASWDVNATLISWKET